MSINKITDLAIKNNLVDQIPIKKSLEISVSDLTPENTTTVKSALSVLFLYIPTEILTLYVAVLGALGSVEIDYKTQWITFWIFILLTPIVVWITYANKAFTVSKKLPWSFKEWPKWEMFAATLSFLSWSFALPQTPFSVYVNWYSPAIASVLMLITSSILGLISPFFIGKTNGL